MDQLPTRPPSICALSAQDVSFETVEIGKICIPANALIITEDEHIFLAITTVLKDLKRVLLSRKVGYVFFGKIGERVVFVLNAGQSRNLAVTHSIKILKPRAAVFLGFCKSLTKCHRVGDLVIAEAVLRKDPRNGKVGSHPCSEYLLNVFDNGRFGWVAPKYRKQAVHAGKVLQIADVPRHGKTGAVAVKVTDLDVPECHKNLVQEWISIVGITGPQCFHSNASWEPYVATVLTSFVTRVLQDDQVFSVLDGEERSPRQHSFVGAPLQESDCPTKICDVTAFYPFKGFGSQLSLDSVKRQAELNWEVLRTALAKGNLNNSQQSVSTISLPDNSTRNIFTKIPVENSEQNTRSIVRARKQTSARVPQVISSKPNNPSRQLALPPIPSANGKAELKFKPQPPPVPKSQSSPCSVLTSSIAVAMQTLLPPLGATLVTRGSCFEIIRIRTQETSAVRTGEVLPSIGQVRNHCSTIF